MRDGTLIEIYLAARERGPQNTIMDATPANAFSKIDLHG